MGSSSTALVMQAPGAGRGKPGYCKVCDHPAAPFLNKRYADDPEGFNAAKAAELAAQLDLTFNRQTWYGHVKHITHPLVTRQREAQNSPVVVPKTNAGALEAIRDIGMQRIVENPEFSVDTDQTLKALSILEGRKESTASWMLILAKAMTGELPPELIEGEWREVPSPEEEPNG